MNNSKSLKIFFVAFKCIGKANTGIYQFVL